MRKILTVAVLWGMLAIVLTLPLQAQNTNQKSNVPDVAPGPPPQAQNATPNARVLPIDSKPYGKAYGEWSGAWWRWAYSAPPDVNPVADLDGTYAAQGQSGPVWFLAGTFGGTANRTVTVPAGKALLIPIYNYIWVNFYAPEAGIELDNPWSEEQEAFARDNIKSMVDAAPALACEVDGVSIADITAYRCSTPAGGAYMVTLPEDNVWDAWLAPYGVANVPAGDYGPCVDDGYYLMLAPLKVGKHTIHFTAGDFLDVMYHITVQNKGNLSADILSPDIRAYGKTLAEWLEAYWRWSATGVEPEGKGAVEFMPLPVGEQLSGDWSAADPAYIKGSIEVTLGPENPFVLPLYAWIAEVYDPALGIPDDPVIPDDLMPSIVTNTLVTLDGQPILQNFWDYYVSATEYDPLTFGVIYDNTWIITVEK